MSSELANTEYYGQKHDKAKPRMSLIYHPWLWGVIEVLEHGADKYGASWGWISVKDARTRYYDALHRHLDAWWRGENVDKDSGIHHLLHAACNTMFLHYLTSGEKSEEKSDE